LPASLFHTSDRGIIKEELFMADVAVIGVGMIPFGRHPEKTLMEMGAEAAYLALKDAGIRLLRWRWDSSPMLWLPVFLGMGLLDRAFFWEVGINRIPVVNIENACTSGSTAFYLAYNAVAAGQVEVAMAVGAEKMCVPEFGLINSGDPLDTQLGLVAPASFALRAVRHMADFGTTVEQMAQVSVKNRRHARHNPYAQFRNPVTLEEVMAAPMIVDPLTRLHCCPIADGAAAAVVCSSSLAKYMKRRVNIESAVLCTGSYENPQNLAQWETDYRGCRLAYEKAGNGAQRCGCGGMS
jgi:acetyl-CoA acetyltransferase